MQAPQTICAFTVDANGAASPATAGWPAETGAEGGYTWLHFDVATPGLADWLSARLPALTAATLMQTETRPRCDEHDGGLILNLRGVNLNPGAVPEDMVSLRLWVAEGLIITARVRKVWAMDAMRARFEAGHAPGTIGGFLAEVTQALTDRIERVSLDLEEETDTLEEAMLEGADDAAPQVASLRQSVIKLRRFVGPQREALNRLAGFDHALIGAQDKAHLRETANRAMRCVEELDAARDRLAAIQDHLDAQRALAIGRNGYVLSVAAAIFLPLGFLTGLFGVNLAGMPGQTHPAGFAVLSLTSVAIGALLFIVFRRLKWL